jgi:hypothetical protein
MNFAPASFPYLVDAALDARRLFLQFRLAEYADQVLGVPELRKNLCVLERIGWIGCNPHRYHDGAPMDDVFWVLIGPEPLKSVAHEPCPCI